MDLWGGDTLSLGGAGALEEIFQGVGGGGGGGSLKMIFFQKVFFFALISSLILYKEM